MSNWLVDGNRVADWRGAIGELITIHQHIRDLDHEGVWANELPKVAASVSEIERTEQRLKCDLNRRYREFLRCANGWPAFYQWVDLFGTEELTGEQISVAEERLRHCQEAGLGRLGSESLLLPIAMTRPGQGAEVPDLFCLAHGGASDGLVLWLSDDEIDRFANFDEFFLAMMDYNREEVNDLAAEAKQQGRTM